MDILEYILIFALGAYVGFKVSDALMQITFKKMVEEAGLNIDDLRKVTTHHAKELGIDPGEDDLESISIKVELHNDTLYVFRKDNDQFLGQGTDKEELIRRLGEKMRGVRLVIDKEDGADLIDGSYVFNINSKEIKKQ